MGSTSSSDYSTVFEQSLIIVVGYDSGRKTSYRSDQSVMQYRGVDVVACKPLRKIDPGIEQVNTSTHPTHILN